MRAMLWGFTMMMAAIAQPFSPAEAFELQGTKQLSAETRDGKILGIGTVHFHDGKFDLALDLKKFKDYFLSMREFKCLDGDAEIQCYVKYPYPSPMTVSLDDMRWLEHSLLFFFKGPKEFGARLQDGLYYHFEIDGDRLVGTPKAVDLNAIAAPPNDLSIPPYGPNDMDDIKSGSRWITKLVLQ